MPGAVPAVADLASLKLIPSLPRHLLRYFGICRDQCLLTLFRKIVMFNL